MVDFPVGAYDHKIFLPKAAFRKRRHGRILLQIVQDKRTGNGDPGALFYGKYQDEGDRCLSVYEFPFSSCQMASSMNSRTAAITI